MIDNALRTGVNLVREKPGGFQGHAYCSAPHPTNEEV